MSKTSLRGSVECLNVYFPTGFFLLLIPRHIDAEVEVRNLDECNMNMKRKASALKRALTS